jgi:hypothetical protein
MYQKLIIIILEVEEYTSDKIMSFILFGVLKHVEY